MAATRIRQSLAESRKSHKSMHAWNAFRLFTDLLRLGFAEHDRNAGDRATVFLLTRWVAQVGRVRPTCGEKASEMFQYVSSNCSLPRVALPPK